MTENNFESFSNFLNNSCPELVEGSFLITSLFYQLSLHRFGRLNIHPIQSAIKSIVYPAGFLARRLVGQVGGTSLLRRHASQPKLSHTTRIKNVSIGIGLKPAAV